VRFESRRARKAKRLGRTAPPMTSRADIRSITECFSPSFKGTYQKPT
jgi:hypothetical protein